MSKADVTSLKGHHTLSGPREVGAPQGQNLCLSHFCSFIHSTKANAWNCAGSQEPLLRSRGRGRRPHGGRYDAWLGDGVYKTPRSPTRAAPHLSTPGRAAPSALNSRYVIPEPLHEFLNECVNEGTSEGFGSIKQGDLSGDRERLPRQRAGCRKRQVPSAQGDGG